jgi:hypothetical protein
MDFENIIYYLVLILFVFMTFGIIKNYYKTKFDDEGHRMDMKDKEDKTN